MSHIGDEYFTGYLRILYILLFQLSSNSDQSVVTNDVVLQLHELFNLREHGKSMGLLTLTTGNADWTRDIRQGTTTRNNGQQNNNRDYLDEP
jgi:hypothetical protein